MTEDRPRYFAWVRQFTGAPVARAYVRDRETGQVVKGCQHRHRTRRLPGWDRNTGQRRSVSATQLAERCARKMLRAFLKTLDSTSQDK
jgi:hypothetical protein